MTTRCPANTKLTIAAGSTASTETVTITANDNDVDTANKTVTVSGASSGGNGVTNPGSKTLTIEDDDERGLELSAETGVTVTEAAAGSDGEVHGGAVHGADG